MVAKYTAALPSSSPTQSPRCEEHTPSGPGPLSGSETWGCCTLDSLAPTLILAVWLSQGQPHACVCAKLPQSCPALCNPMDCSPPVSSVHGIFQARILEPSSRGSSQPRDQTHLSCNSCVGRWILDHALPENSQSLKWCCVVLGNSCPTLCHPMDYSLPSFSVPGILHARILE